MEKSSFHIMRDIHLSGNTTEPTLSKLANQAQQALILRRYKTAQLEALSPALNLEPIAQCKSHLLYPLTSSFADTLSRSVSQPLAA